jgi:hypothetical protein
LSTSAPNEGTTLTNRQLNRSFLARQHLLERTDRPAHEVIEHLVGMQSQMPKDPFIGLWTRIRDFDHAELDQLMLQREAVRLTLMRGTIHLVTARDAYALRPVVQATLEKLLAGNANFSPNLDGLDIGEVVEAGRTLVEAKPLTGRNLGLRLAERWPDRDPTSLSYAPRYVLPLVQVPPRGVWGKSMQPTLTTLQAWLGEPVDPHREPDDAILRYLAAFGPATVADVQAWSGMSGLREAVKRLRPRLVTYRDEGNRELFDVPGAPFPDPETPAPIRFLPGFENALLSHADRTRIISDERRKAMWRSNGLVPGSFLVDGHVAGTWKTARDKGEAAIEATPFEPLTAAQRDEVEREATTLLDFLEADADVRTVRINEPA